MSTAIKIVLGIVLALLSVFLSFYTIRLFYVTHMLTTIRPGGQGAYVGAIVFPLLSILFGWCAWRLLRSRK